MDDVVGIILLNAAVEEQQRRRILRERRDPLTEMSDIQFRRMFRLTKELVRFVIGVLEPYLAPQLRPSGLDINTKVLVALRFYASGSYQLDVASNLNFQISQSSASRCIKEVTDAFNTPEVFNRFVFFPRNRQELNSIRTEFNRLYQFPGVIGCIDCTHVAIFPPHHDDENYPEHLYVNRKNYHSLNVQLICDSKLKILNVNASFPGSTNDAFIWNASNVQPILRNLHAAGNKGYFLLGDSGYPLRSWLLTPLEQEPLAGTPEYVYQQRHKTTRSTIERCNGVLKARFRCLLKHRVLHYAPEIAGRIVNACVILHNICIENRLNYVEDDDLADIDFGIFNRENDGNPNLDAVVNRINPELAEGRANRAAVVRGMLRLN